MNTDWARGRLESYLALLDEYGAGDRKGLYFDSGPHGRDLLDRIAQAAPTVQQIGNKLVGRAEPTGSLPLYPTVGWQTRARTYVMQLLGIVRDREEVKANLAPSAPIFTADRFHPWVWDAASAFWNAGQRPAAVEYGAKSLSAWIQKKSGSQLSDRELASDVFSPKPRDRRVRLWLPGERDTDTWRSRQDGLHLLAMGAFAGIRNVVAHSVEPGWSEQEALEYLAVLSTVARWADETTIEHP